MTARVLLALLAAPAAAWAQAHPVFARPFRVNSVITAGYDTDRSTGRIEDWRGWSSGDPDGSHRPHPYSNHTGTDFAMVNGTPLYAAAAGVVYEINDGVPYDDHSATNYVKIRHPSSGLVSTYWHMAPGVSQFVTAPQSVLSGQAIGLSDNTGNSTGGHLHFGDHRPQGSGCPFRQGHWLDPGLGGRVLCAQAQVLNVRAAATTSAAVLSTLRSGQCVYATEERSDASGNVWARHLVAGAELPLGARLADGCDSPALALAGSWRRSAVQSAATARLAHGSWAIDLPAPGASVVFALGMPRTVQAELEVIFPGPANARLAATVGAADGATVLALEQVGRPPGLHGDPILVTGTVFTDQNTTVGGESLFPSYGCAPTTDEGGPERVYRISTVTAGRIYAEISMPSGVDVDVHLLRSLDPADCVDRGNVWAAGDNLPAGTYYVVVDTYRASGTTYSGTYSLRVETPGTTAGPSYNSDRWVALGQFTLGPGATLRLEPDGEPPIPGRPARAYVEAVRVRPVGAQLYGWSAMTSGTSTYLAPGDTSRAVVVTEKDAAPLHAGPSIEAGITSVAPSGQYFAARAAVGGFVGVDLAGSTEPVWIDARHLTVFDGSTVALARECPVDQEDASAVVVDRDGDGVLDALDKCPDVRDASQEDRDQDGAGDACDACPDDEQNDADEDGVCGDVDLCPTVGDPAQADSDSDGWGDACDPCPIDPANDGDHDNVCGDVDLCPAVADSAQADADGDSAGDACDACPYDLANDRDGDSVCGDADNCPESPNGDQADRDLDGAGNACDACPANAHLSLPGAPCEPEASAPAPAPAPAAAEEAGCGCGASSSGTAALLWPISALLLRRIRRRL